MAGLFQPGGLMGPLQEGMPAAVNPLALLLAGAAQGQPLNALRTMGTLQQAGARTAQTGAYQQATLAAQEEEAQRALAARANQVAAMRALAPVYARQRAGATDRERTMAPEAIASQEGQFSTDLMNMYRLNPQLAADEIKRVMAPKELSSFEQKMALTGLDRGSPEYQRLVRENIVKPAISLTQAPTGYRFTPEGMEDIPGGPADPLRVTPSEAAKARTESRLLLKGYDDVSELIELVEKHGPEAYGPVSQRMNVLHGSTTMGTGVARGMGALQAHEAQVLAEQIPNPAKLRAHADKLRGEFESETLLEGLRAIQDEMRESIERLPPEAGVETAPASPRRDIPRTELPAPTTQDEYDALPSGTTYIDPDTGQETTKR